jgi:hypothetical protein
MARENERRLSGAKRRQTGGCGEGGRGKGPAVEAPSLQRLLTPERFHRSGSLAAFFRIESPRSSMRCA